MRDFTRVFAQGFQNLPVFEGTEQYN